MKIGSRLRAGVGVNRHWTTWGLGVVVDGTWRRAYPCASVGFQIFCWYIDVQVRWLDDIALQMEAESETRHPRVR